MCTMPMGYAFFFKAWQFNFVIFKFSKNYVFSVYVCFTCMYVCAIYCVYEGQKQVVDLLEVEL